MPINYAAQKVLIVDDFADFRRTVRAIVQQLGIEDIDQAGTAEDALKLCKDKHYDIILSDYNLGEGKDGQQLLEELKFLNLLKNQDVFLMITAENTSSMVMGALDYVPDGYLTKPFNKAMLQNRLEKVLEKKTALAEIDQAIERRQLAKALELCQHQIESQSPHALACIRTQAEILEQLGKLDAAANLYRDVIASRPLPWAMLGLGKLHFQKAEYEKARALFEEILRVNPMFLNAFDWLAKTLAAEGKPQDAQRTLEAAVKISPKTIVRQMELGQLARQNDDLDASLKAYRSAIRLGKNSCYNTPDNYLAFVECVQKKLARDGAANSKAALEDSSRALTEANELYRDRKDVLFRLELQRAQLLSAQDKAKEAESALAKAESFYQGVDGKSVDAQIDYVHLLTLRGKREDAQSLLQELVLKHGDHPKVKALMEDMLEDKAIRQQAEDAHTLNIQGVQLFENNEPKRALACFMKARELMPNNISVNLNTAQVIIELCQAGQGEPAMLKIAQLCIKAVEELPPVDRRHPRYQELARLLSQYLGDRTDSE